MAEIETSSNLQIQNALWQEMEQLPSTRKCFSYCNFSHCLYKTNGLNINIYTEIFKFTNISTDLLMHFATGLFHEASL